MTKEIEDKNKIEEAIKVIRSLYPTAKDETCVATKSDLEVYEELFNIKKEMDRLKAREDFLKLHLMASMKSAAKLTHQDKVLVTYQDRNRSSIDTEYLKSKYHNIWEECTKIQSSRHFVIKYKAIDEIQ